jgi:hypothetical protein
MVKTTHRGSKLAALIAAGVVVLGGVAAASGSLPTPAQSAAHDALGVAGMNVPDGDGAGTVATDEPVTTATTSDPTTTTTSASDGSTTDGTDATDATDEQGPDPTGPAKFGLCTAYAAGQGSTHGHKNDSTAFRALAAAAAVEAESVTEFCADATPAGKPAPTTTTPTTPAAPISETGSETATTGSAPTTRPSHQVATPNHGAAAGTHGNPHLP